MSNLLQGVHSSWLPILQPHVTQFDAIESFLNSQSTAGIQIFPQQGEILRAFDIPFDQVRVVIVGQDPYPTRGHAMGLAFSVTAATKPLPKSLVNIFKELNFDCGCDMPSSGDLGPWMKQGVMLLNRTLTVQEGNAGSHRTIGWDEITCAALSALSLRSPRVIAILWGKDAQRIRHLFDKSVLIESPHPSPLSAHSGFFGSKPFSQANTMLIEQGSAPIDWCLP